ncbi:MAG: cyclase family protein [Acidobacteriota bacterium]
MTRKNRTRTWPWMVGVAWGLVLLVVPAVAEETSTATVGETSSPFAAFLGATFVDLTHSYDEDTIYWPTEDGFVFQKGFDGVTEKGYYYAANSFCSAEHGGTHLDAPIHFAAGKQTADEIPLERLIGPAVVVDVRAAAAANADHQVSVEDLTRHEAAHGRIADGSIVLIDTGFSRFWPDRTRYMGTDERGAEAVAKLHFPGLHPDAARWLVEERTIHAIGLDTPSIDFGQSTHFRSHQILFEADIPAFENVAHLDRMPPTGALVIALPMKIRAGSGGPLRIVGVVPAR